MIIYIRGNYAVENAVTFKNVLAEKNFEIKTIADLPNYRPNKVLFEKEEVPHVFDNWIIADRASLHQEKVAIYKPLIFLGSARVSEKEVHNFLAQHKIIHLLGFIVTELEYENLTVEYTANDDRYPLTIEDSTSIVDFTTKEAIALRDFLINLQLGEA